MVPCSILHPRDYPNFYTRLYAFLTRDVLHLKHRARFFRLTGPFLSSSCVPPMLRFFPAKKSQSSARDPPGIHRQTTLPPVSFFPANRDHHDHHIHVLYILKLHPACIAMIHHDSGIPVWSVFTVTPSFHTSHLVGIPDPFDAQESSPYTTNALSSTLARIFSEAFTKPVYAMEDFLSHTYGTVRTFWSPVVSF